MKVRFLNQYLIDLSHFRKDYVMTFSQTQIVRNNERIDNEAQRFEDVARYNIRRYMRLTGKYQKDLAKALGCSRPAVTLVLNGDSKLYLKQLFIIAVELGVTVDDLLNEKYYQQDQEFLEKMHKTDSEKERIAAGVARPRSFVAMVPPVGLEPTIRRGRF